MTTTTAVCRRAAPVCSDEADAQIAEGGETKKIDTERANEAEAEQRRNAYLASGTDEGGRSYRASSDAKSWSPMLSDDPKLKASLRTAAIDRPIEKDKLGNGIIDVLAGGVLGGVHAVAGKALTGGGEILAEMAMEIGKDAAKEVVKHVVIESIENGVNAPLATPTAPTTPPGGPPEADAPAGRSNASGASEVVPRSGGAADQCVSPPYVIRG